MSRLSHRQTTVFAAQSSGSATPVFGQTYVVRVFSVGARAASASSGSTITVDAGHSFQAGDKFLLNPGTDDTFSAAVDSVTATTVVFSPETYSIAVGDILVNLGPDTGSATPNYDGSKCEIYQDPDASTAYTNSSVTCSATGSYEYWHKGNGKMWEVVFDSAGDPVTTVEGIGGGRFGVHSVYDYGAENDPDQGINAAISACNQLGGGTVDLGVGTLALSAGDSISALGNDYIVEGHGDVTSITQTNSSATIPFDVTGDRITLRNFKLTGNRVAAGTLQHAMRITSAAANCRVEDVFIDESGSAGIACKGTDIQIVGCRINNSDDSGIQFDGGATACIAQRNRITNPGLSDSGTTGGITVFGDSGTNTSGIKIIGNYISNATNSGIRVSTAENTYPTDIQVIGNEVDTTGTGGGEGITMTCTYGTCIGNLVKTTDSHGYYAAATSAAGQSGPIAFIGNVGYNVGQSGPNPLVKIQPQDGTMVDVTVIGNVGTDDQVTPTQARLVEVGASGESGTISGIYIDGNVGSGSTNSDPVAIEGTGNDLNLSVGKNIEEGLTYDGLVHTFTSTDATPSVKGGKMFKTAGTTAITDFDDGALGQEITIVAASSITITDGAPLVMAGNFAMTSGDTITFRMVTDQVWSEICRSDND